PGPRGSRFRIRPSSSCASVRHGISPPPRRASRARLPSRPNSSKPLPNLRKPMTPTEHTMKSWDNAELFYRAWQPPKPSDTALLLFHRGNEHSGRWQEVVDLLALEGVAVFAWDARGHGRSPGERGSAENLMVVIKDTDAFVRHISESHRIPLENMV